MSGFRGRRSSLKNGEYWAGPLNLEESRLLMKYTTYSWFADPQDAHEKLIWQGTRRVTTNPRLPLECSRRGEIRSEWSIFV